MMPPPNVTGSLHIGHALTFTIQDILTRYYRLQGRDVLWQPGMDHAGIATQMVVERQLDAQGISRHDLGREKFIDKVWEWKEQSGGMIFKQLRRLGASADWSRQRFTMDDGLCTAVRKAFVRMYKDGLIYQDKRLVNWDPKLHTSISDLEVVTKERKGHLWHIKYPIEGEKNSYIIVATTRPETMLGDTGVAVHPEDERYKHLIGKNVVLPLTNRLIPIVGDEHADPETGTGAVKITPAHDFNDFEVGKRHNLPMLNIMDENAHLNDTDTVPEKYRGLFRDKARKVIVEDLEALGLLDKITDHVSQVPYGDRSDVVVEPMLMDQWYVDAQTLAKPAIKAIEDGDTKFVPANWEKTYFQWMRNIQPWCISRQLWWGHRIPVWHGPDGTCFCEETDEAVFTAAEKHYGKTVELVQDNDVLDTWFSSGLWSFSTLGWPDKTPELGRYYPTSVLVTGFDIIFFWVARMMMMSMHFMNDENGNGLVPFKDIYIHALVRDEKGQKMSKSKGNVIDPLILCDKYGADSVRFTLAAMAAQGRDIALGESRVEGYRNFATKLWNATRFCELNGCTYDAGFDLNTATHPVNQWVISEFVKMQEAVKNGIEQYKFNEAANALYHFAWGIFCDWYIELTKPILAGNDEALATETKKVTSTILLEMLKCLSPIMPFISDEIARNLLNDNEFSFMTENWFDVRKLSTKIDKYNTAGRAINWLVETVTAIRSMRAEKNLGGKPIPLQIKPSTDEAAAWAREFEPLLRSLARVEEFTIMAGSDEFAPDAIQLVVSDATLGVPLGSVIDVAAEKARLTREMEKTQKEIDSLSGRLANENFVSKAPEHVVNGYKQQLDDLKAAKAKLDEAFETVSKIA